MDNKPSGYRSLFWPIVFLGVGILWLLASLNILPNVSIMSLIAFWPAILIIIGLDLLIGRQSQLGSAILGGIVVAGLAIILIASPKINIGTNNQIIHENISEPLGSATSAQIQLNLAEQPTMIDASANPENLIEGSIDHTGTLSFEVSGNTSKTIKLERIQNPSNWQLGYNLVNPKWEIGLNPTIPLDLNIDSGSGSVQLSLKELILTHFAIVGGSGSIHLTLPESQTAYSAELESGSGSLEATLPQTTPLTITLSGGSGSQNIIVPLAAPLRVEVRDSGSGSIHLPDYLKQISGSKENDEGVWESENYTSAENPILIIVEDHGSGSLRIDSLTSF